MEIRHMCGWQNHKNPCPETFNTKAESNEHFFKVHGLTCNYCEFGTIHFEELENHLTEIHNKHLKTKCKDCDKIIEGYDEFIVHVAANHGGNHPPVNCEIPMSNDFIKHCIEFDKDFLEINFTEIKRKLSSIIPIMQYNKREELIELMGKFERSSRELDDIPELVKIIEECNHEFLIYQDYFNTEKAKGIN